MNNTLLIILAVALLAGGVAAWYLLSRPGDVAPVPQEMSEVAPPEPAAVTPERLVTDAEAVQTEAEIAVQPSVMWAADGIVDVGEYAHTTTIVDVDVHWTNDQSVLRVGLESPGTGYVAIGFDPEDRMEGANFIIGYVQEGEVFIRDDIGTGPTSHAPDTERAGRDNVLSAGGAEWADHTVIEFVIPLDSGDEQDKALEPGSTVEILIAYHDLQDGFSTRHSRRGSGEIELDPAS